MTASATPTAHAITQRHFLLQDLRPSHLSEIDPTELDPYLRGLLFTDGTVTRTIEVKTLSRVSVQVVDQTKAPAHGQIASHLDVPDDTETMRRRVVIGPAGTETPAIWAESHILPDRLPAEFLSVLNGARDGIGESLQRVQLESWRDMLWFGLDSTPEWFVTPPAPTPVITRLYRVIAGGQPTLLISESFAVERSHGAYHLKW